MIIEIPEAIKQAIFLGFVAGILMVISYFVGYVKGQEK